MSTPTTATRIRLYGWVPRTDYVAAAAGTFAQLVQLSREAGHVHYLGDLYHDALTLSRLMADLAVADDRSEVTFYFMARESGTHMWTGDDLIAAFRSNNPTSPVWRLTVSHELSYRDDGVWFVTIDPVA